MAIYGELKASIKGVLLPRPFLETCLANFPRCNGFPNKHGVAEDENINNSLNFYLGLSTVIQ